MTRHWAPDEDLIGQCAWDRGQRNHDSGTKKRAVLKARVRFFKDAAFACGASTGTLNVGQQEFQQPVMTCESTGTVHVCMQEEGKSQFTAIRR